MIQGSPARASVHVGQIPPTGPGRVDWHQQVRRALACDLARCYALDRDGGASEDQALAIAELRIAALFVAIGEVASEAMLLARGLDR